jgi:hypothetical protein
VDYIHTGLEDLDPTEANNNNNDWNPALSMNTDIDLFDPTIDSMFSTDMDWVCVSRRILISTLPC